MADRIYRGNWSDFLFTGMILMVGGAFLLASSADSHGELVVFIPVGTGMVLLIASACCIFGLSATHAKSLESLHETTWYLIHHLCHADARHPMFDTWARRILENCDQIGMHAEEFEKLLRGDGILSQINTFLYLNSDFEMSRGLNEVLRRLVKEYRQSLEGAEPDEQAV